MSSKRNKPTGWFRTWYSKVRSGRRLSPAGGSRKLFCEMLERRELLSATVHLGLQAFKTISVITNGATGSGTSQGTTYTAHANLVSPSSIVYDSPTHGVFSGTLSGTLDPPNSGNLSATIAMTQDSSNPSNTQNLSGSFTTTAPTSGTQSATGNINTSTFVTTVNWSGTSTGTWTGTVQPTGTTSAFDIIPTTPQWDSAAQTQIDFGFTVAGTWHAIDPSKCGTPLAYVQAFWASGTGLSTVLGSAIGGDSIPVYWNQASGTASIQGISAASIPWGAHYVLISVADDPTLLPDENTSNNLVSFSLPSSTTGWRNVHVADVTGDGKADIVGMTASGDWWVAVANAAGTGSTNQYWGSWNPAAGWQDVQVADVNGDGKADIVGRTSWGDWWVALSTGTSFTNQYWGTWNPAAGWQDVKVADVNGDGKADIVGMTSYGDWWVALAPATGTGFTNQYWGTWNPSAGWQNVQVADLNGDHMADIIGMTSTGDWWVGLSNGTSFTNQYWGSWNPNAGWQNVQAADFNGDGKADIVGRTSTGDWWVGLSNGTSFATQYWGAWNPIAGWTDVQVADVNGDGKADIVGHTSYGDWWVAVSSGTGFTNQYWGSWNPSAGWQNVQVGDFNGDGKADIVGMTSSGDWWAGLSNGTVFANQYWGAWNPNVG